MEKCKLEKEIEDMKFNITKDEENEIIEIYLGNIIILKKLIII